MYCDLVKEGAPMGVLDIGGGMAVDYDGSHTNFHSSCNYSIPEYCTDIIETISQMCDKSGVHHPDIISESGRAVVVAVNKWDAVDEYARELVKRSIETRLGFLKFAAQHLISAQKRQGLGPVWDSIAQAHKAANCKMSTPVLTRLLLEAVQFQTPKKTGMYRPKLRYAHQGGMNPPIIIIHGNSLEHVTDAYKRFLEGRFRKEFNLIGTPLRIQMKSSQNPYSDKDDK